MSTSETFDLFRSQRRHPAAPPRRPKRSVVRSAPSLPWRSALPWRETQRGLAYVDPARAEAMIVALAGEDFGEDGIALGDAVSREMAEGRLALRVFEMRGPAPSQVPGASHLSARAAQLVRQLVNGRSEARGYGTALPFRCWLPKTLPTGPLHHGYMVIRRSFDLGLVGGGARRAGIETWPTLTLSDETGRPERGCALVIGAAGAASSWSHLADRGALAVWPAGSRHLWLWKTLPGHAFPRPGGEGDRTVGSVGARKGLPSQKGMERPDIGISDSVD